MGHDEDISLDIVFQHLVVVLIAIGLVSSSCFLNGLFKGLSLSLLRCDLCITLLDALFTLDHERVIFEHFKFRGWYTSKDLLVIADLLHFFDLI